MAAMTASRKTSPATVVGWREWIALPDLGVAAVKAKIDTGARSSSLHAMNVETFDRDGATWVRFDIHPLQGGDDLVVRTEAAVLEFRRVRSSSGHQSLRPVIGTTLALAGHNFHVELTLARRDEMGFRMLLGRQSVRGRFVVDPGRSFLIGRGPTRGTSKKKHPKKKPEEGG